MSGHDKTFTSLMNWSRTERSYTFSLNDLVTDLVKGLKETVRRVCVCVCLSIYIQSAHRLWTVICVVINIVITMVASSGFGSLKSQDSDVPKRADDLLWSSPDESLFLQQLSRYSCRGCLFFYAVFICKEGIIALITSSVEIKSYVSIIQIIYIVWCWQWSHNESLQKHPTVWGCHLLHMH